MISGIAKSGSVRNDVGNARRRVEASQSIRSDERREQPAEKRTGTALVPARPDHSRRRKETGPTAWLYRPYAPALAQLIATKQDLPQTRARRRAEPSDAAAAYGDARKARTIPEAGRLMAVVS
ncbi:hypothetical protein [Rhodobium gokarnense]|uniref:SRNA-binding protein n=1 Tax=Rhodobium gokarnense TaxID=364296 RepID=A0ABT3HHM7_9HYPH|nr:hypothetical protein [Rhodobium gokarnense]MCW2309893.1 sRNA-binding protein [Rhodobium gokarnense]